MKNFDQTYIVENSGIFSLFVKGAFMLIVF